MPRKTPKTKATKPAPAASPAGIPPAIAALTGTLAGLGDATVVTRDQWQGGGVEMLVANQKFAELTGYAMADLAGKNTKLLHGPRTHLVALGGAGGGRLRTGEGWLYRKGGAEFYAAWNFSPILLDGKPSGCLVGIYRDFTENRRLREALLQSQKLDTVGLLASGVAHDFNNLLSVINGYCEIMAAKIAGVPAAQKDLQEIHRAGLKASAIARQILEFSRRQETEVKVINFNTLIREIAEILRRVGGDDISLELRLASDLGNARMDPTQFQQVLLNLCFNARDAMPQGGKLSLRTYNLSVTAADATARGLRPGLYAVLRVTDTGHGMEPAVRETIFEPFFTTKPNGTGLGLPTVLGIIQQHDGRITVESEVGHGSTFEIFLPETAEPEQTSVTKLGTLPAVRGSEAVLIVEADDVLRKMIAGILSTDGYQVADVATPEEAGNLIKSTGLQPQLVIVHAGTRAGSGLVRKIHATNRGLRLVTTSAQAPEAGLASALRKNLAHLPKPFALSTLLRSVRSLLDSGGA